MNDRAVLVDLACGCSVEIHVPCDGDVGVELITCPDHPHNPQLVTWRQIIVTSVATLDVPHVEIEDGANIAGVRVPGGRDDAGPPAPPAAAPDGSGGGAGPPVDTTDLTYHRPGESLAAGDLLTSPKTADEWKAEVKRRDFSHALLLQAARDIAGRNQLEQPRTLGDIDEILTPLVLEWLDAQWPLKEPSS